MTSPFANSRDPDFIYAAHQPSHLSPQIPSHSNSEVASIENYGYNRTRDGSEEDLFRGLNSYRVSGTRNHEFKTYLLDGKIEKPWTADKKYKAPRKGNWYILGGLLLAIALSAVVNWRIAVGVPNHEVRLPITIPSAPSINLSGVIKSNLTDLVRGHSTGQQLMAETPLLTKMDFTSFLLSQLRQPKLLKVNYTMAQKTAQYYAEECSRYSNISSHAIINPVRSARLTTQGAKSIKYGRVEVVAKVPKGDWLWPAIWMMPEDSVYGIWPLSGEIDIMESRGNARGYKNGGRETVSSTIHWGERNSVSVSSDLVELKHVRTDYSEGFHTFGLEWSEDYLYTFVDNRLQQVLYVDFKKQDLWQRGHFQGDYENGTLLTNPWYISGNKNAPFDQKFYLILNVAVGSRNGWFSDGVGSKPWVDGRDSAASDFYGARSEWEPSWGTGNERGLTVKNVKMWQQGKCST
ncbi:hypothetical protein LTR47_000357 [Exophiala xenobiotica]|nr:hypothetical protein LTR41_004134 [Exophiala xenobiotica]KAK5238614.1 hypothetical protein LTR47_000357 [Exophiala xenobiotica]KAK5302248.1 hypothetical protein LTR14_000497 [Exophiala xenobiotica]KAK5350042.1 hypothetical protein LTR61_006017 [Exophiala xenobiotica]KAK5387421.1 hypothetical protein LTR11_001086 [Exophiala xenobiotica]